MSRRLWPIRAYLASVMVAATLLSIAAALWGTTVSFRQAHANGARSSALEAQVAVGSLAQELSQIQGLAGSMADQPAIQGSVGSGGGPACQTALSALRSIGGRDHLDVVAPGGAVICTSSVGAPKGTPYAGAGWLHDTVVGGRPTTAVWSDGSGALWFIIARPVPVVGGRPLGALAAVVSVDEWAGTVVGPTAAEVVLAGSGGVIADRTGAGPATAAGILHRTGRSVPGADGDSRVYGEAVLQDPPWRVQVGLPTASLLAPAHRSVRRVAVEVTVFLGVLLGLLVLFNRRLGRPLRHLTAAVTEGAESGVAALPADSPREIMQLAEEFDRVTAARADAQQQLALRLGELARAQDVLQRVMTKLTSAQEDERRRIAIALHDETVQSLIATRWAVDLLEAADDEGEKERLVAGIRRSLDDAVVAARRLIVELRPPALDESGLGPAVDQELARLSDETGTTTTLAVEIGERLPAAIETLAFRTAQEALRNVRRHAHARHVGVSLMVADGCLRVDIADDGVGFDPRVAEERMRAGHLGLASMRESVTTAGGRLAVERRAGGGTLVTFVLPVDGSLPDARSTMVGVEDEGKTYEQRATPPSEVEAAPRRPGPPPGGPDRPPVVAVPPVAGGGLTRSGGPRTT